MKQTLTSHSSIYWVALQTVSLWANFMAVSEGCLPPSAANNMKMDWANASTKVGITESNWICWNQCIFSIEVESSFQYTHTLNFMLEFQLIWWFKLAPIKAKSLSILAYSQSHAQTWAHKSDAVSDLEWSILAVDTQRWYQ